MYRAQTVDHCTAVDADDFAVGKDALYDVKGNGVVFAAECRDEDDAVADIEVGVACGKGVFVVDFIGHGDCDDFERVAVGIGCGFEYFEVFFEDCVISAVAVFVFDGADDRIGVYEAGDVVDVSVGIVAFYAAVEPDYLFRSEVFGEVFFYFGLREPRVSVFVQEALLCGEQESSAVYVD